MSDTTGRLKGATDRKRTFLLVLIPVLILFFERKKIQHALSFGEEELWERVDTWDLLKTFSQLMSNYKAEHILDLYEEVSVNEKITLMNEICIFVK